MDVPPWEMFAKFAAGSHFVVDEITAPKIFSRIKHQRTPIEIEVMGDLNKRPKIIPRVPKASVPRKILINVSPSSWRPDPVNQALVLIAERGARAKEILNANIATATSSQIVKKAKAKYFPRSTFNLDG